MNELTHETCSELLGAYASGTLPAPETSSVENHLASCSDCSLELAGLRAITAVATDPMTGAERDQLSRAVRAAIAVPVKRSWSERFGRRVAPALGAAALLAIAAVAIISLPGDRDTAATVPSAPEVDNFDSSTGGSGGSADEAQTDQLQTETAQGGVAEGGTGTATKDSATATNSARGSVATEMRVTAATLFYDEAFAVAGLDLGSLVPPQVPRGGAAARSYRTLARSAPDDRVAHLITECAEITISTSPFPLVATSAAYYSADDVLVIGFSWVEESTRVLNYQLRGWREGRCDRVTPIYRTGVVQFE